MTTKPTRGSRTPPKTTDEDLGEAVELLDEDLTVGMPGFKATPSPGPDPLDPETTTVTEPSPLGSAGESGVDVDERSDRTTSTTGTGRSSRASTDALPGFTEITRTLVGLVSLLVRTVRARTLPQPLPAGAWIATEDDQQAIGDPLARIVARHAPITGEGSKDVVDGVSALVGATGYAMRSLNEEAPQLDTGRPDEIPQP